MKLSNLLILGISFSIGASAFADTINYLNWKYVGQTKRKGWNKIRHGKGYIIVTHGPGTGDKCEGTFVEDIMTFAKCTYSDSSDYYYEGEFAGEGIWNSMNGKGTIYDKGTYFFGTFVEGKQVGPGSFKYKSGATYEGEVVEMQRHGNGSFIWDNGSKRYDGQFYKDALHGSGLYKSDNEVYEGEFINNQRTGQGILKFKDGSWITGNFINGKVHGRATWYKTDKSIYMGTFNNGVDDNAGRLRKADGTITSLNIAENGYEKATPFPSKLFKSGTWAKKNLNEVTFKNGESLINAKNMEEWKKYADLGIPAYFKPPKINMGFIYNIHAIKDPRGLALHGWRIPNKQDILSLCDEFGGLKKCDRSLRDRAFWPGGANHVDSGFDALESGYIDEALLINENAAFWITDSQPLGALLIAGRDYYYDTIYFLDPKISSGYYIRLIKE